ncbi:uncharacterized protein YbjT (DUF2867 family) [Povalibacter uvarum]|uniref:Uncharacterized protein YbjT (DUF2867 family) n=1 Tax=Povalibacter uvarum TaxID=732238 RepID=A0A841HLJ4_9GAMM|nr:SDR family oxidoreductase [Povalibacter uvarum]MBB6093947.1 uncharacterized protein YbjT (DUF2867 family) [Povalibacter uvarum]
MRIVVIGGSGVVGTQLVDNLRRRGHDVVAASRRTGVNTLTGDGLVETLAGAKVLVDVTNSPSFEDAKALEFFGTSTRNLLAAAEAAHVKHCIALSIVGTDRLLESGYFRAKMAQEDLVSASPIPHTILRSTQFFEFLPRIAEPDESASAVRVSPALVQPLASGETAAALADIATAAPRNGMIEFAGPQLLRLDEVVRRVMQAQQDPREVIADRSARYFGAPLGEDTLIPDEGAIIGVGGFDEWLESALDPKLHRALPRRSVQEQGNRTGPLY